LTLAQPVAGWNAGDRVVVPDTRQLTGSQIWSGYTPQWEVMTVQSISSDGTVVTLTSPLQYDHRGAVDADGKLTFLPHIADLTHNVVVRSQSATGTRGHVLFTARANVNIQYAQFSGLGRTTKATIDNTTYDSSGNVTHVGTNQDERYPVYFDNLIGPAATPTSGYQYTFSNNSVFCPLNPMPFVWGVAINNSDYGLISGNFLYNWAGAGLITLSGQESFNVIQNNFVLGVRGDLPGRSNTGLDGSGYWFRGWNNTITNNVATDCVGTNSGIVSGSGFYLYWPAASTANTRVPLYPGADVSQDGQYTLINMLTTPVLNFSGNTAYGAIACGLSNWEMYGGGTIKNFTAWHVWEEGCFCYPVQNVTFDGFTVLGDPTLNSGYGWRSGDYFAGNVTIQNANIQAMNYGIGNSLADAGTFTIKNSYFRNLVDVSMQTLGSPGSGAPLPGRTTVLSNDIFAPVPGQSQFTTIQMDYEPIGANNFVALDQLLVYNYNGVAGNNFQVYYLQQAPTFILPQSDSASRNVGAPVAGITNAQAWAQYGIALAGAVAPTTNTMQNIVGYVQTI
jgi:hypothetical protein